MTSPSLADLLRTAGHLQMQELHVALPGRITEYDASRQKAKVQPLIKHRTRAGDFLSMPVINNVPVLFPRGGGALMSFPVQTDDQVLLIFAERSIDEWLSNGGEAEPADPRMHDLSDAVAIPGVLPFGEAQGADAEDVLVKFDDAEMRLTSGGGFSVGTRSGFLRVNADGKVALGGSQELLGIVAELIDALVNLTTTGSPTTQAVAPPTITQLNLIKAKLQQIQE